jgi:ABC-type glycerol-3-phosphate transport system substrate-binding protein
MNRLATTLVIALVAVLLVAVTAPALATQDSTEGDTTTTTVEATPVSAGDSPAVVVPLIADKEEEQPWTARFVYPLLGVLAILIIGGFAVGYNRSIRRRYEVVG